MESCGIMVLVNEAADNTPNEVYIITNLLVLEVKGNISGVLTK